MLGLTTTRRLRAEVAAVKVETDRQRERAEKAEQTACTEVYARRRINQQYVEADAANRRLLGRNLELGRRISSLTESDPEYAGRLERRVARLLKVIARLYAGGHAEKLRADHLQARLDDACGLNHPAVTEGRHWQSARHDKKGLVS